MVFLALAVLLIVVALISALTSSSGAQPYAIQIYPPIVPGSSGLTATAVFRSVILGAFAGVAFFLGLACFAWSALTEARRQRADILLELTALRTQLARTTTHSNPAPGDTPS